MVNPRKVVKVGVENERVSVACRCQEMAITPFLEGFDLQVIHHDVQSYERDKAPYCQLNPLPV